MSSVTFHSREGEAVLRGRERAFLSCMVDDFSTSLLSMTWEPEKRYRRILPSNASLRTDWKDNFFLTWLRVQISRDDYLVLPYGKESPWNVFLNTAVASGSDFLNLAARIHATCEIHGYVEGEHRAWLADIMEEGRRRNIFRPDMGWEEVIDLLRSRDDGRVVMSYSVTDWFPDARHVMADDWYTDDDYEQWSIDVESNPGLPNPETVAYDKWDALSADEQWDAGVKWLDDRGWLVDMSPENWQRPFGGGPEFWTMFDLERWLDEQQAEESIHLS